MNKMFLMVALLTVSPLIIAMDVQKDPFKQDPFKKDEQGNNGLHREIKSRRANTDIVGNLLSRGEEKDPQYVNAKNDDGNTALHMAVIQGQTPDNLELIRYLVYRGADLNARNKKGQTPLERAIEHEQYDAKGRGAEYREPAWIGWLRQGATGQLVVTGKGEKNELVGVMFGHPKNK